MYKRSASLIMVCAVAIFAAVLLVTVSAAQDTAQTASKTAAPGATAAPAAAQQSSSAPQLSERYPRYRITAGDAFDVAFEFSPEFNQSVTVQPDGYITLRDIGDVHIAGETVPSATERLRTAYEKILANPSISIVLKDFNKAYFTVNGEVGKPGKYELRADTTVTEGVAEAGGFLSSAKHSQVLLFRRASDQWVQARIINVKKMMKDGDLKEDMFLQPGDMLFVRKNALSKIDPYLPKTAVSALGARY
jgi:polysaccharide export outer membrane protein